MNNEGKKNWYIVDGWLPCKTQKKDAGMEGHEAIMILNCSENPAKIVMDVFYEDRDPTEGIRIIVPGKRVKCIRMDHPDEIGGLVLEREQQYSLRLQCTENVVVQYGRMDITQPNLAYIGFIGYSE